ncbi:MAG: AMP-binding protein [Oscillospiraceae bacterium]|jgi:phenylacetate-coenzyme A ligase PaaK-like adenylate-forming protein|nr:AMP-binding protein [Oscillospiraceae bacterium]
MTHLTEWLSRKLSAPPTRANLDAHIDRALRKTLDHAAKNGRHYSKYLQNIDIYSYHNIKELLKSLPFSYPAELRDAPLNFLCVPPHEVLRVVTIPTSGTTGNPKRVYFSQEELESTADFFNYGMRNIARAGGRVMIFMRGGSPDGSAVPGGVCDILTRGLARFGAEGIAYGEVTDADAARRALIASGADCAVGIASQLAQIARLPGEQPELKSALLSADNIPPETVTELEQRWGCEVFSHFGMTETAFGGAVDCAAHAGMHIREPDMLFEIIDPATGENLPDGERGELVLTTLTRRVMPLVRYRTGDISEIIPGECPCGCALKRLGHVDGRET